MRADGTYVKQLTSNPQYDSFWGKLSPDRTQILFYRTPKGVHDRDYTKACLWVMNADGYKEREIRIKGQDGWLLQCHVEWAPDGQSLIMSNGLHIFITDIEGQNPRQITNRAGSNVDPSWAPDGLTVLFVGWPVAGGSDVDYEVYVVSVAGVITRLTTNTIPSYDPYYSPDGTRIAWLEKTSTDPSPVGTWNIMLMDRDGANKRSLTNDDQINSKPNWSRDGSLIYFHRFDRSINRWQIFTIQPDGSGLRNIAPGAPGNNEYPCS